MCACVQQYVCLLCLPLCFVCEWLHLLFPVWQAINSSVDVAMRPGLFMPIQKWLLMFNDLDHPCIWTGACLAVCARACACACVCVLVCGVLASTSCPSNFFPSFEAVKNVLRMWMRVWVCVCVCACVCACVRAALHGCKCGSLLLLPALPERVKYYCKGLNDLA